MSLFNQKQATKLLKMAGYLLKKNPYSLEKPIVLQFPVIDICNSQCQMCRIWENKKSHDLSPDELRKGIRNPLYTEVISVGINGGEPTLRKDLGKLVTVLFEELPKLHSVSLITNAYKTQEVIDRISDVGEIVRQYGGALDVMVSLDGFDEMHDRVRGKPGNFQRAQEVIDFIQTSPLVSSVRIGCTIIKENVFGLADLFEYCQSRGLYIKYRLGIPHQRLYTQNLTAPYSLSPEEKYHVAEFLEGLIRHYETSEHQNYFYRSLIDQIIHNAPRKAGCDWKHRGATITSTGELLYCAVQSKALGKIHESDSKKIFFDNESHLRSIIENKCASCTHDYVGIPAKKEYFRQLAMRALQKLKLEPLARKIYSRSHIRSLRNYIYFKNRLAFMNAMANKTPSILEKRMAVMRVLICGWYGTETLGDKAILAGLVQSIRLVLGEVDFTLVSLNPYVSEMTCSQMSDLKEICIVDSQMGVRLAAHVDLVVFGGGPLMALNELADMEAIFGAAKAKGVPSIIAGCGLGPLGAKWHNSSLKNILSMASLRIYRDAESYSLANELGITAESDLITEDPAFTWLHSQRAILNDMEPPRDHKVLLLGLRDFPYHAYARDLGIAECEAARQRYEHAVIKALEMLVRQHTDLTIRPLPMCTNHFGDDDRWFYRKLFRNSRELKEKLDLSLLGAELQPIEYCKAFKSAHVVLAMRFHSLVFALGLDVPSVAIDYTLGKGKVHALAERFSVPFSSLLNLDAEFIVREVNQLIASPKTQARNFEPSFTHALSDSLTALVQKTRMDEIA